MATTTKLENIMGNLHKENVPTISSVEKYPSTKILMGFRETSVVHSITGLNKILNIAEWCICF